MGTLLRLYVRDFRLELGALATAIGRHPSQISRIVKGQRGYLPPETLKALVSAVSEDRDIQANLVVAYLLDQTPDDFRDDVEIRNARDATSIGDGEPVETVSASRTAEDPACRDTPALSA